MVLQLDVSTGPLLCFAVTVVRVDVHEPVDDFLDRLVKLLGCVAVLLDTHVLCDQGLLLAVTNNSLLVNLLAQYYPATCIEINSSRPQQSLL